MMSYSRAWDSVPRYSFGVDLFITARSTNGSLKGNGWLAAKPYRQIPAAVRAQ